MSEHERRTRRFTISPTEAAALDRLLDMYLATEEPSNDPGWMDLAAFKSRIEHAQMDHSAYDPATSPDPTLVQKVAEAMDDYQQEHPDDQSFQGLATAVLIALDPTTTDPTANGAPE